jgi:hypothetical protein
MRACKELAISEIFKFPPGLFLSLLAKNVRKSGESPHLTGLTVRKQERERVHLEMARSLKKKLEMAHA